MPEHPPMLVHESRGGHQGRSRKDAVVDWVLDALQRGTLAPHERLPPEGELALSFGVSRTVVREAMKSLAAVGVVRIEQGRGTFVTAHALAQPFSLWATMNLHRLDELYEVRTIIESETVSRAARNAAATDLRAMERALDAFRQAHGERSWHRVVAADCDFHLAIARACGLPLLAEMLETSVPVWTNVSPTPDFDRAAAAADEHARILTSLVARDARRARLAMVDHIEGARQRLRAAAEAEGG